VEERCGEKPLAREMANCASDGLSLRSSWTAKVLRSRDSVVEALNHDKIKRF
jgi:hypothetical protein